MQKVNFMKFWGLKGYQIWALKMAKRGSKGLNRDSLKTSKLGWDQHFVAKAFELKELVGAPKD